MRLTESSEGPGTSLAVRDPDVLHLRRLAQELASLTLPRIRPVPVPHEPGAFHVPRRRLLDDFARPRCIGERAAARRPPLPPTRFLSPTGQRRDAGGELRGPGGQILRDIVEDLRAQVPRATPPVRRPVRRFHRVANVLAVPFP